MVSNPELSKESDILNAILETEIPIVSHEQIVKTQSGEHRFVNPGDIVSAGSVEQILNPCGFKFPMPGTAFVRYEELATKSGLSPDDYRKELSNWNKSIAGIKALVRDLQISYPNAEIKSIVTAVSGYLAFKNWSPIHADSLLLHQLYSAIETEIPFRSSTYSCARRQYDKEGKLIGVFSEVGSGGCIADTTDRLHMFSEALPSFICHSLNIPCQHTVIVDDLEFSQILGEDNAQEYTQNVSRYARSVEAYLLEQGINVAVMPTTQWLKSHNIWEIFENARMLYIINLLSNNFRSVYDPRLLGNQRNDESKNPMSSIFADLSTEVEGTSSAFCLEYPEIFLHGKRMNIKITQTANQYVSEALILRLLGTESDMIVYSTKLGFIPPRVMKILSYMKKRDTLIEGAEEGRSVSVASPKYLRKRGIS